MIVAAPSLVATSLPWNSPSRGGLWTVVAKGSCTLSAEGELLRDAEALSLSGDLFHGDDLGASLAYPSDLAYAKARAEVVVDGFAYPSEPGGAVGAVSLRFGEQIARDITVTGERRWSHGPQGTRPSEPEPFDRIRMCYENAFGGPASAANPVGRGAARDEPLPNLEDPTQLLGAPGDRPRPACLAAVSPLWKRRSSRLGTYGRSWLANRWPHFAEDLDPDYFQAAPPQQQLKRLRGDELFEITGMRPDGKPLKGALPGYGVRCFAMGGHGEPVEVAMRLDTVVFDTEQLRLSLVWRGQLAIHAEHAPEVETLHLLEVALDAPELTEEERLARFEADRALLTGEAEDPAWSAQDDALVAEEDGGNEPPAAAGPPPPPDPQLRGLVVARLAEGKPLDGLELAGVDLTELDLGGASLVGADLSEAKLKGCRCDGADFSAAVLDGCDGAGASFVGARLASASLVTARLVAATFTEADLTEADFSGADCGQATFVRATGEAALFIGATCAGCDFGGATLPAVDFSEAELAEARLDRARMPQLRLYDVRASGASFVDAELDGARANSADLTQAKLRGATLADSVWDGSQLDGLDLFGAVAPRASLIECGLRGAILSLADLREARLLGACLDEAVLNKTNLMKASLEAVSAREADFRGANLYAAETWQADLEGALLELAMVAGSKLEGEG